MNPIGSGFFQPINDLSAVVEQVSPAPTPATLDLFDVRSGESLTLDGDTYQVIGLQVIAGTADLTINGKVIAELPRSYRLTLTGTPIANALTIKASEKGRVIVHTQS